MGRIGCNGRELEFEEHKEYHERPYQLASQRSRFCKTWCSRNLRHPNGNWISELMSNPWRSVDPLIMFNCKMQWRQTLCSQMRITIRALYGSLSLLAAMPCEARALGNIGRAHFKYRLLSNADQGLCTWSSRQWVKERSPCSLQKSQQEKAAICTACVTVFLGSCSGLAPGPSRSFVLFRSLCVIKGAQASVLGTSKR